MLCPTTGATAGTNWIKARRALVGRIGEIGKLPPDMVKGYQALWNAGQKTNLPGAKTRELISLAHALRSRCDGCIRVHTAEALKHGAMRGEIAQALGVAVAINAGAAMVYSARTMDAVAAHSGDAAARGDAISAAFGKCRENLRD